MMSYLYQKSDNKITKNELYIPIFLTINFKEYMHKNSIYITDDQFQFAFKEEKDFTINSMIKICLFFLFYTDP